MSSPAAAGVALLIRQYFSDTSNTYWSSLCNSAYKSCKPFVPSGVLVKALLLHSGSSMVRITSLQYDKEIVVVHLE